MKAGPRLLLLLLFGLMAGRAAWGSASWPSRPYRALLVVEHWSDPASVLVDHEKDDFQPVAALLKAWAIPFDILRLDQQHLDDSYLLDREGRIRYGVVIWLADAPSYRNQGLIFLQSAIERGTCLVVAHSRFLDPTLEQLLGLKFNSLYTATDPLRTTVPHFITRELASLKFDPLDAPWDFAVRPWVETTSAQALIVQGTHPILSVNAPTPGASVVWMGVPNLVDLRDAPYWRGLFFRTLVWSLGYVVAPNIDYARSVEFEIDDWGSSDKGYLSYWHYREPDEHSLHDHLIAPLAKRHAVVSANVISGYIDRQNKRIISPWSQQFTDAFGLHQDFASTQRGLKAAVAAGVLEIQSHGWTHVQPDLESPPGPWWTADLAGEASVDGWYKEFADERRGVEIPAIVQLFRLQRSLEYLQEDFGQRPLEFREGGGGWSKSYANNTALVAARAGFGLFHAEPSCYYYLDRNLVLDMNGISPHATISYDRPFKVEELPAHPDGPFMAVFHDRDISLQPDYVERLLASLPPNYEIVSANQLVAYEHARIESSSAEGWALSFDYDEHYCPYFAGHPSRWRMWVSDAVREQLQSAPAAVSVDGKPQSTLKATDLARGRLEFELPAGLGHHVWRIASGSGNKE